MGMPQCLSVPVAAECARPMVTCAAVPPRSPAQRSRPQHGSGRLPQPASPTLLSSGPMGSGGALDFGPLLVASASAAMSRRARLLYLSVGAFCEARLVYEWNWYRSVLFCEHWQPISEAQTRTLVHSVGSRPSSNSKRHA